LLPYKGAFFIAILYRKSSILNQIAENELFKNCFFFKNCDLKMQKNAYSQSRQCDAFLKTPFFKRLTCDFTKRLTAFLKIIFLNRTF